MAAKPFDIGVVGAGLMGTWHAAYARLCGGKVCGIADVQPEIAARLARKCKVATSVADLQELLLTCKPQIVHICTPTASHESLVRQALDGGLHVIVEKPFAASADSTAEILKHAKARDRLVIPAHQFIFQQGTSRVKAFALRMTKPAHVDFAITSSGGTGLDGDSLDQLASDVLPHPLSLLAHLFPDALKIASWTLNRAGHGEWRLTAVAAGVTFSILISFQGRPTECSMLIRSADGTMHHDLFHDFVFFETGAVSKANKILHPFRHSALKSGAAGINLVSRSLRREFAYPGLRLLIQEFYSAVRNEGQPPLPYADVLQVARTRDGILALL